MTDKLAFVGDIHGNLGAAHRIVRAVWDRGVERIVFLGDYINKGERSAEVLTFLIDLWKEDRALLLMGNHEAALLEAIETGVLGSFLRMGGAMTIRSYVQGHVGPDVLADLLRGMPLEHLEALRAMPQAFEIDGLVAQHIPRVMTTARFQVSAHVPVGPRPRIGDGFAMLDTGCGDSPTGRLTAFLWPSQKYLQVEAAGEPLS